MLFVATFKKINGIYVFEMFVALKIVLAIEVIIFIEISSFFNDFRLKF